MPRQKLTIEQAKLTGAFRRNPGRYKPKVIKAGSPVGGPPDHLTQGAKTAWKEIVEASTPGVLQAADRILIEITACLMDEFRSNPNEFKTGKHSNLIGCFTKLGLTPADRQRVQVADTIDPDDPAEEFFRNWQ